MCRLSMNPESMTASVIEYGCLFSHDLKRKQKRWKDGRLKFHTFNQRVMVYDERGNSIGDMHWQESSLFGEGEEIMLDRGGLIVQVCERKGQSIQDLSTILIRKPRRSLTESGLWPPDYESPRKTSSKGVHPTRPQKDPSNIGSAISSNQTPTKGPLGRAQMPDQSPFEQRKSLSTIDATTVGNHGFFPSTKRRRYDEKDQKSAYATSLFGTALSLNGGCKNPAIKSQMIPRLHSIVPGYQPSSSVMSLQASYHQTHTQDTTARPTTPKDKHSQPSREDIFNSMSTKSEIFHSTVTLPTKKRPRRPEIPSLLQITAVKPTLRSRPVVNSEGPGVSGPWSLMKSSNNSSFTMQTTIPSASVSVIEKDFESESMSISSDPNNGSLEAMCFESKRQRTSKLQSLRDKSDPRSQELPNDISVLPHITSSCEPEKSGSGCQLDRQISARRGQSPDLIDLPRNIVQWEPHNTHERPSAPTKRPVISDPVVSDNGKCNGEPPVVLHLRLKSKKRRKGLLSTRQPDISIGRERSTTPKNMVPIFNSLSDPSTIVGSDYAEESRLGYDSKAYNHNDALDNRSVLSETPTPHLSINELAPVLVFEDMLEAKGDETSPSTGEMHRDMLLVYSHSSTVTAKKTRGLTMESLGDSRVDQSQADEAISGQERKLAEAVVEATENSDYNSELLSAVAKSHELVAKVDTHLPTIKPVNFMTGVKNESTQLLVSDFIPGTTHGGAPSKPEDHGEKLANGTQPQNLVNSQVQFHQYREVAIIQTQTPIVGCSSLSASTISLLNQESDQPLAYKVKTNNHSGCIMGNKDQENSTEPASSQNRLLDMLDTGLSVSEINHLPIKSQEPDDSFLLSKPLGNLLNTGVNVKNQGSQLHELESVQMNSHQHSLTRPIIRSVAPGINRPSRSGFKVPSIVGRLDYTETQPPNNSRSISSLHGGLPYIITRSGNAYNNELSSGLFGRRMVVSNTRMPPMCGFGRVAMPTSSQIAAHHESHRNSDELKFYDEEDPLTIDIRLKPVRRYSGLATVGDGPWSGEASDLFEWKKLPR